MSKFNNKINSFLISIFLTLIVVLLGATFPIQFNNISFNIKEIIGYNCGWLYLLIATIIVFCCFYLLISPIGQIKLGNPDDQPEYSLMSWFAMLFSAGMGIGLVFWGAAEPLSHFAKQAPVAKTYSKEAINDAFKYTFFHWGIHAWAIYALIGLALAYFKFRKKETSLLSVTLKPLFGNKMHGFCGSLIDSLTIFATVIGVATTLGLGAYQINGGLHYLFNIPNNVTSQIIIIIFTTLCFILTSSLGLGKGMKLISNINLLLAILLLAICIVIANPIQIMNQLVESIGNYLQDFVYLSFRTGATATNLQKEWINHWTIFYWAWWISWSPFVGMFIARISKGRTIREFLIGVIFIPTILSCLWFSTFGTLSISIQKRGYDLTKYANEEILFATFKHYPFAIILSIIAIILVFTFFITSADSATYVLAVISEKGKLNPKKNIKIIWGILLAIIAIILLIAGGLEALQNVLIIVAFPFAIILILILISLLKELHHEQRMMGLKQKPDTYPSKNHPFKSYED